MECESFTISDIRLNINQIFSKRICLSFFRQNLKLLLLSLAAVVILLVEVVVAVAVLEALSFHEDFLLILTIYGFLEPG
jgi:hypothetical protein